MAESKSNRMYIIIGVIVVLVALVFFFMSGADDTEVATQPGTVTTDEPAVEVEPVAPAN